MGNTADFHHTARFECLKKHIFQHPHYKRLNALQHAASGQNNNLPYPMILVTQTTFSLPTNTSRFLGVIKGEGSVTFSEGKAVT